MSKPLIALLTNHDDDVYCFRKELIEGCWKKDMRCLFLALMARSLK